MLNMNNFVEARAAMCRRMAEERALRFGREIKGPAFDDDSMIELADAPPAPPMAFHLIYQGASQELSGRCITVRQLKQEIHEVRVVAYCHFRSALRTFLASRMVEVTDLSTGEVDEDGLAYFQRHPLLQHMTADHLSTLSPELLAVQECRDELILLSFVAASDGDICESEEDELVKHVFSYSDEPLREAEVRRRVRLFVPDEHAFDHALQRICSGVGNPVHLLRTMRKVVDADGEIDIQEVAFANDIEEALRAAGRI